MPKPHHIKNKVKEPRKCKACGEPITNPRSTTQKVCSYMCALQITKNKKIKEAKTKINKQRKVFNMSDRKWLKSKINTNIQAIARYIDYGRPCLARPTTERNGMNGVQFHGGHVWSKGSTPEARWNVHNVHCQNAGSNNKGSDDYLMFMGLEREYGIKYRKFVESLKGKENPRFKVFELQEIYTKSNEIKRRMGKHLKRYNTNQRIEKRNEVNKELGVYDNKYSQFKIK